MEKSVRKIGELQPEHPLLLAPLAGITDSAFRQVCREFGAAVVYSEMISAKGMYYNDKNTEGLLRFQECEKPIAYQLFGSEPEIMALAVKQLKNRDCCLIDVNMGCPVPKVAKNGEGAALMKTPELATEIVKAMVKAEREVAAECERAPRPITVKCRMGWDAESRNAVEFAVRMQEAGAAAVGIHGRTRDQYYEGQADWEIIGRVKEALDVPVIGSGDVFSAGDAMRMLTATGCDFVMAARGALGNPWIFRDFRHLWNGMQESDSAENDSVKTACSRTISPAERRDVIFHHMDLVLREKGENRGIREMRKHVSWYVKGVHGAAEIRRRVNAATTEEQVRCLLNEML